MSTSPLLSQLYLIHMKLTELEKTPRDYGTGELLYSSDVHTLESLSLNEGCNLTELAAGLNVSKPAAFKFVRKLLHRGYILKSGQPGSAREVAYHLSDLGREAVEGHREFRNTVFAPLEELILQISPDDRAMIHDFLEKLNNSAGW